MEKPTQGVIVTLQEIRTYSRVTNRRGLNGDQKVFETSIKGGLNKRIRNQTLKWEDSTFSKFLL